MYSLSRRGRESVATCSRKQAVFIIGLILATLLTCSLIIAFVRPSHCGHVEEGLDFHEDVAVTPPPEAIATNGEPFPWNDVRLPDFIVPLRYSVVLHPNLTTLFLRGQMEVVFAVQKETNFIVFHGKDVTLTYARQQLFVGTAIRGHGPHGSRRALHLKLQIARRSETVSHWRCCCCCRPARKRLLRNINGEKWREG